jgi:hypothetical protein
VLPAFISPGVIDRCQARLTKSVGVFLTALMPESCVNYDAKKAEIERRKAKGGKKYRFLTRM